MRAKVDMCTPQSMVARRSIIAPVPAVLLTELFELVEER